MPPISNTMLKLHDTWIKFIIISISSTTWKSLRWVKRIILGNETSEQDLEDSEDNVPLKELVRKEFSNLRISVQQKQSVMKNT